MVLAHPQPPGLDPAAEPVEKTQGPQGPRRSSMSSARRRFSDVQLGAEGVGWCWIMRTMMIEIN